MIRSWLAQRRAFNQLVDVEASALAERAGGAGYYTARQVARLAHAQGDADSVRLWVRIARQVAARTGHVPGRSKVGRPESEW